MADLSGSGRHSLRVLSDRLAVCQLSPQADTPGWARLVELLSITRTRSELSIVCSQRFLPPDVKAERDWRAFEIKGPLDFSLTGVLAGLSTTLAQAEISLFALSTYDTDYLLVKDADFERARLALTAAGHAIEGY